MPVKVKGTKITNANSYLDDHKSEFVAILGDTQWQQSQAGLQAILQRWIDSDPTKLTSKVTLGGLYFLKWWGAPRSNKAYWKNFPNDSSCATALIAEYRLSQNGSSNAERAFAKDLLKNPELNRKINELRRRFGKAVWANMNSTDRLLYFSARPIPLSARGSYNWSGTYPSSLLRKSSIELLFSKQNFTTAESIAILHDLSEYLYRDVIGEKLLYTGFPYIPRDRLRVICRNQYDRLGGITLKEMKRRRLSFNRGKIDLGTRDETAKSTLGLRQRKVPVEAGYSYTIARMLAMTEIMLHNDGSINIAPIKFDYSNKAVKDYACLAIAQFAFWNAGVVGSYPLSMTPVHTWNEVTRAAAAYGVKPESLGSPNEGLYLADAVKVVYPRFVSKL